MDNQQEVIAAIQAGDAGKLRELLARDPALAAARDAQGVSAIMHAQYRQRQELVELLLQAKPELDIFEAAALGRSDRLAQLLRQQLALIASWSADGFTPLHLACFFGQETAAQILLEHGADVAAVARNPMKVAPLHSAVAARSFPIVRALLEHGAPPNARQQQGWTAIHAAAQHGDRAMVELLLAHGADPATTNDDGTTPLQLANEKGHAEIVQLLRAA